VAPAELPTSTKALFGVCSFSSHLLSLHWVYGWGKGIFPECLRVVACKRSEGVYQPCMTPYLLRWKRLRLAFAFVYAVCSRPSYYFRSVMACHVFRAIASDDERFSMRMGNFIRRPFTFRSMKRSEFLERERERERGKRKGLLVYMITCTVVHT